MLPNGKQLTARMTANRRPGYDFTFDAPKSVSILHAMTRDERIPEAMRQAVAETMSELEEEMHARVRKDGAFEDRKTSRMIWADFTHFTSRPAPIASELEAKLLIGRPWLNRFRDRDGKLYIPDPDLHMHVYAINATFDETEGIWKAGEFFRIKRDASYYQAAYHTRLAQRLQKLGYQVQAHSKCFEVVGVPRESIEVFSRRTREVEEAAKRLGITSAEAKSELGALTRHRKNGDFSIPELRHLWKAFLSSDQGEAINRVLEAALAHPVPQAIDKPEAAMAGVDFALKRELERVSEVSKRRLIGTALENSIGKASIKSAEAAFSSRSEVLTAMVGDEVRVTTKEVLKEERRLIELVQLAESCESRSMAL